MVCHFYGKDAEWQAYRYLSKSRRNGFFPVEIQPQKDGHFVVAVW